MKYLPLHIIKNIEGKDMKVLLNTEEEPTTMTTLTAITALLQTTQYKNSQEILTAGRFLNKNLTVKTSNGMDYVALEDADFDFLKKALENNQNFLNMGINIYEFLNLLEAPLNELPKEEE